MSQALSPAPSTANPVPNLEAALAELQTGTVADGASRRAGIVVPVLSISDDRSLAKVRLCTGRTLDVPLALLRNIVPMGSAKTPDASFGIASAEIDISTSTGRFARQMADELMRLTRMLEAAHARLRAPDQNAAVVAAAPAGLANGTAGDTLRPADAPLPEQIIKIPFTGTAGFPVLVDYGKPVFQYIQQWSIFQLLNCQQVEPPRIVATGHDGNRPDRVVQIEFTLDAAPGTPVGTAYNATLELDLFLVQETT